MSTKTYLLISHLPGAESTRQAFTNTADLATALRVKAVSGARYELVEQDSGFAPQQLQVKRSGKNLLIGLEQDHPDQPSLVLEDFYEASDVLLIGPAESTKHYPFIPDTANPLHAADQLQDGMQFSLVLGGYEVLPVAGFIAASPAVGVFAFGPLLGALGLGGLAAAAGGGGGDGGDGNGAPTGPAVAITDVATDNRINLSEAPATLVRGSSNQPNATLTLTATDQSNPVKSAQVQVTTDANGNWQTPINVSALSDGDITFTAAVSTVRATQVANKDTVAPTKVEPEDIPAGEVPDGEWTAVLDPASDSGIQGDLKTNDTTPTISGRGEPGDLITVTFPTGEVKTAVVNPEGNWTVTPDQVLPTGPNTLQLTATDPHGNASPQQPLVITIDTSAPIPLPPTEPPGEPPVPQPGEWTARLDPASDTGLPNDRKTNDTTPTLIGRGDPGDTIRVVFSPTETKTTTIGPDGSWSIAPDTPLTPGAKTFEVTAIDTSGNISAPINLLVDIDTIGITAQITNNFAALNTNKAGPGLQLLNSAESSNGVTYTITLNETPRDTVFRPVDLLAGDLTVQGASIRSDSLTKVSDTVYTVVLLPASSNNGTIALTVSNANWRDDVGNTATPATDNSVRYDNLPSSFIDPASLVNGVLPANRWTAALDDLSDSGRKGDLATSDTTPTIAGRGQPGDSVQVVFSPSESKTTTVSSDGTWSLTPDNALVQGPNNIQINVTDTAGNPSPPQQLTVTIDTTPPTNVPPTQTPAAGEWNVALDPDSDSGIKGDAKTNDTTPTLEGKGDPGDTIRVVFSPTETKTTTIDPAGNWSITPDTPLTPGDKVFVVTAIDPSGNPSAPVNVPLNIDTTGIGITVTQNFTDLNTNLASPGQQLLNIEESKNGVTYTIELSEAPRNASQSAIDVLVSDLSVQGASVVSGSFTKISATQYTVVLMPETSNAGTIILSVAAGKFFDTVGNVNTSGSDNMVHYDTIAPGAAFTVAGTDLPQSGMYNLNSQDIGNLPAGGSLLFGTRPSADTQSIQLLFKDSVIDPTPATPVNGIWSFPFAKTTLESLPDGLYTAQARITDTAGNVGISDLVIDRFSGVSQATVAGTVGGVNSERFINTDGNQTFTGGGGNDSFFWLLRDKGTPGAPDIDRITDFALGNPANDGNADRLNLSDLIFNPASNPLRDAFVRSEQFDFDGTGGNDSTRIMISHGGQFSGANTAAVADQWIELQGVLTDLNTLTANGQLII